METYYNNLRANYIKLLIILINIENIVIFLILVRKVVPYLVNELKILAKEYYDEYICSLSKIKKKKESPNYISKDIFSKIT